ncbi:GH39 family glycosyl hydrolase [Parasediminibacterium sp. JCM 36343]|uniref:GH39 family glycosyl hydrolase n=1 Tax=Parasediminibacterium sp. JCM 36343 TaxID=3374279 RepID=UPI00397A39EA
MERRDFIKNSFITASGAAFIPSLLYAQKITPINSLSSVIDANAPGIPLTHFWSKCVGAGRANEGLRASWLEQMELAKKHCGFQFCRFHGLFHDDMCVYKEEKGNAIYNWQYIDDLFDRMLAIGVKPFVELGFMPKDMASTTAQQFWWKGNVSPPKDHAKWAELVSNFVKHCISRYGMDEVKSWYFEVWNEPDLHGFWDGTKSQYFELYKTSVLAIKAIDKSLRVGGPSTSNFVPDERFDGEVEDKTKHKTLTVKDINTLDWHGVWIKDFLAYCTKENLPVDFICTHPYPTDWALDPDTKKGAGRVRKVNATTEDLQWLKKTVAESAHSKAEIHCTEWSSSPSPRDSTHDSLQAATYVIKANVDSIGLVDSLSYWTFTDVFEEKGAGDSIFHGGFGLINYQGIAKPAFHAYRMLNRLGDEVLHKEEGMIVTRHSNTKKTTTLLFHYPSERKDVVDGNVEEVLNMGTPRKFTLDIKGLKPLANITIETLDRNHGFAFPKWKAMGSPEPPTREQTKQLKEAAFATLKEKASANAQGGLKWEKTLQPWDCILIEG